MLEQAKFVWHITLGDLGVMCAAAAPLMVVVFWLARIERKLNLFLVEHEYLMADLAQRQGVDLDKFPTRHKARW